MIETGLNKRKIKEKEKVKIATPPPTPPRVPTPIPTPDPSPEPSVISLDEFQKESPFNLANQIMTKPYSTSFNFKKQIKKLITVI